MVKAKQKVKFAKFGGGTVDEEVKKTEEEIYVPGGELDSGELTPGERGELARLEKKCLSRNAKDFPTVREMMLLSTLRAKGKGITRGA